jgi:hypothetical protein
MPNDAIYHRTLSPAFDPASNSNLLPASQPWTRGYWLSSVVSNYLKAPVPLYLKPNQHFDDYATQFEKDFSTVISAGNDGNRSIYPVIDNNPAEVQSGAFAAWPDHEVVAHLGWVQGYYVHVPRGMNTNKAYLSDLLAKNDLVWVARESPSGYQRYGTSETLFHLGTQIDGSVIWHFDTQNAGALQQTFADDRVPGAVWKSRVIVKEVARRILLRF